MPSKKNPGQVENPLRSKEQVPNSARVLAIIDEPEVRAVVGTQQFSALYVGSHEALDESWRVIWKVRSTDVPRALLKRDDYRDPSG
jgi:hypothetical protein